MTYEEFIADINDVSDTYHRGAMTQQQIDLLKRCIHAVRTRYLEGEGPDWEMVEVGWISGVNPRTAESLVRLGLLEYCMPSWANEHTNTRVRLAGPVVETFWSRTTL